MIPLIPCLYRGQLTTLKLSPNLRLQPKDPKGVLLDEDARVTFEVNKMTKLLSLVRDPESVTNPKGLILAPQDEKQVKNVIAALGAPNATATKA
jgi:hypothetical protein